MIATALMAASLSGASEQAPEPIATAIPPAHFGEAESGPFSTGSVAARLRPLGPGAPGWARRLYQRSVRVLVALTDPETGAMIAGERDGWDYVWPRDAAAGALAFDAAGLRPEARRVAAFLTRLDLDDGARFYSDGEAVPGRPEAGDAAGWVAAAQRTAEPRRIEWRGRQDYGENVTGDLLGNAIAAGAPAAEIESGFGTRRGLTREPGGDELDSSAAWAATVSPSRGVRGAVKTTLLELTHYSSPYGIPPIEGWKPGEVWTAPTAWSAWALVNLGETRAADRLLAELRRAATPPGTLPERVDARTGEPTSTTPLAWSHAFAILALRARYGGRTPGRVQDRRIERRESRPARSCPRRLHGRSHGFLGSHRLDDPDVCTCAAPQRPALQGDHRSFQAPREGDLGQRAPLAADGDHGVTRGDHGEVPGVTDAGRDRMRDVLVRVLGLSGRQDADDRPAALRGASRRRLHDPGAPATDEHRAGFGDAAADGLGVPQDLGGSLRAPDHGDLDLPSHERESATRYCAGCRRRTSRSCGGTTR